MNFFFLFLFSFSALATEIPVLTIKDSINPGTMDYITRGIERADKEKSPFLILELDTPGGLLSSTRKIVQTILSSKVPVIVYVAPKGAQAGSAGALITLAADIAAMAPGTNIGAAHPVSGGGEKIDKKMDEKVTNDTAAFAESLAKMKGRNTDWARDSVIKSASITAEDALSKKVIEIIANDRADLLAKLNRFLLPVPKISKTLPDTTGFKVREEPMNLKQRLVSFFADPTLAYLILSLGGLCIWVELTHPGLLFPGILGGLCVLVSLVSFQMLPIHYGALLMIFVGLVLLLLELFVPSFGALGIGGILSFVFGSLYLMDTESPDFRLSLGLILPTAAVLASAVFGLSFLLLRTRKAKVQSGLDTLIGEFAEVREDILEKGGKVFIHGELWNAKAESPEKLKTGSIVRISKVKDMVLFVEAFDQKGVKQ